MFCSQKNTLKFKILASECKCFAAKGFWNQNFGILASEYKCCAAENLLASKFKILASKYICFVAKNSSQNKKTRLQDTNVLQPTKLCLRI